MSGKILDCNTNNLQCGNKCQPRDYRCPSEKSPDTSTKTSKVVMLIGEAISTIDLNAYYKHSEKVLDPLVKKARRTEVGSREELKKQLLREEERAWVFLRLSRQLKRSKDDTELEKTLKLLANGDEDTLTSASKKLKESIEAKKVSKKGVATLDTLADKITESAQKDDIAVIKSVVKEDKADLIRAASFEINGKNYDKAIKKYIEEVTNLLTGDANEDGAALKKLEEGMNEDLKLIRKFPKDTKSDFEAQFRAIAFQNYRIKEAKISLIKNLQKLREANDQNLDFNAVVEESNNLLKTKIAMLSSVSGGGFSRYSYERDLGPIEKYERSVGTNLVKLYFGEPASTPQSTGDQSLRNQTQIPPVPQGLPSRTSDGDSGDNSLRNFLENADVLIQVPTVAMQKILDAREFGNAFFKGTKALAGAAAGDKKYLQARKVGEKNILNVDENAGARERPIYGYAESPLSSKSAFLRLGVRPYGEVQIKLKPDVKKRSTVTFGDSLGDLKAGDKATPMLSPSKSARSGVKDIIMEEGDSKSLNFIFNGYSTSLVRYIEVQIFGGLKLSDIEEVRIPAYLKTAESALYNALISAGIKVITIDAIDLDLKPIKFRD